MGPYKLELAAHAVAFFSLFFGSFLFVFRAALDFYIEVRKRAYN
jgi:hypothetical protein